MTLIKRGKRIAALILALALGLSGCAGQDFEGKETSGEKQLGRYVEEFWRSSKNMDRCSSFTRLEDGSLAVFSFDYGPYRSQDEGKTWESWLTEWYEANRNVRFQCAAIAPDGRLFAGYVDYRQTAQTGQENGFFVRYQLVDAQGKGRELAIEEMRGEGRQEWIMNCWFAPDGTLYGADHQSLYEISAEDGGLKKVLEGEKAVEQLCFWENDLLAVTAKGALLYDRETKDLKDSDAALDDFIREKAAAGGEQIHYASGDYNVYLTYGPDGTLYLACAEGIYAHKMGGGTMEKLLEGSLCSLGDPDRPVYGMLVLPENGFLMFYQNGIGKITYDEDMPSVPEKELRVYSLQKDEVVQKAVSLFRQDHPEVYVNYEIGMSENSGQTTEDVIKALNTEILAGKGPDVLILDGFPMKSYMEKGLLADLSQVLEVAEEKEELYDSLAGAFRTEGKVYAIPVRCKLPVVMGPEDLLENGNGLEALVAGTGVLRAKKESGSVMGGITPYGVLRMLALSSAPSWEKKDGSLEEEKIREFLAAAQQVYEQEKKGVTQEEVEEFGQGRMSGPAIKGVLTEDIWLMADTNAFQVFMEESRMGIGIVNDCFALEIVCSVPRQKTGVMYDRLTGQSENVFLPYTIAGISASAGEKKMAEQFLELMLSEKAGSNSGFYANKAVNEGNISLNREGDGLIGSMTIETEDGNLGALDVYGLTEEDMTWFDTTMQSLKTPYLPGSILENAVLETGVKVLEGEMDIPEAMTEIQGKVKLSLAE